MQSCQNMFRMHKCNVTKLWDNRNINNFDSPEAFFAWRTQSHANVESGSAVGHGIKPPHGKSAEVLKVMQRTKNNFYLVLIADNHKVVILAILLYSWIWEFCQGKFGADALIKFSFATLTLTTLLIILLLTYVPWPNT